MEEFSSLTPAQVVSRLLTTANDSGEYSQRDLNLKWQWFLPSAEIRPDALR